MTAVELMTSIGQIDDSFIQEAQNARTQRKPRFRRSILIAVAATLLLLLAGCTIAYLLHYPAMMETIFGTNGRSTYSSERVIGLYESGGERAELNSQLVEKYIEPFIFPVEGTIHDGNRTLTALSCIVDRTSCTAAVYLKLENPPEYTVYNSGQLFFQAEEAANPAWYIIPCPNGQPGIIGRMFIDASSTTENELYFILMFSCEPGYTNLELKVDGSEDRITIPLPKDTAMPSLSMGASKIRITPFGMKLDASLWMPKDQPQYYNMQRTEMALQFRDGSEYLLSVTGASEDENYKGYTYGMALTLSCEEYVFIFNRVVELSEVTGFRINEIIYTIDE